MRGVDSLSLILAFRALGPFHNRGYLFTLNESMLLDAARLGNEMRYLNHMDPPEHNSRLIVSLVNGEHRVGVVAGEQAILLLLFLYQENFRAENCTRRRNIT